MEKKASEKAQAPKYSAWRFDPRAKPRSGWEWMFNSFIGRWMWGRIYY